MNHSSSAPHHHHCHHHHHHQQIAGNFRIDTQYSCQRKNIRGNTLPGHRMNEKMPIKVYRRHATVTLQTSPAKMLTSILSTATSTATATKVFATLFLLLRICTISSNAVLAAKVSAVNVDKPTGQRFAMEPQDQTAIVGSRVTLPCRVVDKVGKLQWTKDDFGLGEHRNLSGFDRYSMVGSDEEGDYSLDIYPVMLDDDARYQCQVGPGRDGQAGIRSRFATLTILVPPEPPKINQGDFMVTTEDREIELECISVGGKPAAEITWIDGLGNVLTNGIEYVKEPLADTRRFTAKSILKLTPKKEHHNTTFTCQAQNTADRNYRSAKLKLEVKYAPKVSVSVIGGALAGGRILEGAEVRLSCRADANPDDLKYHWYINDEVVVGDYTTEMIIHNVTRKFHDAIVKCEVLNAVGKSEETETLDISYGPAFKTYPKSVEADVGATVVMTCDVDGNPQADIVWIYDPKDRVVGTSTNLTVVVSHETAGRYYCKASIQGFPEIGAEASVYVKSPPTITSQRRQYGIEGDNTRLECAAFSVPKARHVSWTYNGKEINTSNDHDYSILEDPLSDGIKSTLIINESQTKHFGRYNCTVVNDYGNDFLEIDLIPSQNIESRIFLYVFAVCAIFLIAVVLISVICLKRGNKKEAPADLIKNHQKNTEKGCKDSDRSSNISDLKIEREHEYSETCSGTDSIATRLNMNTLTGNGLGGVPLAGPVKIPSDYRYSGDYTDAMGHFQNKSGQNNNGYVPYVDYTRDYSPPPQSLTHLRSLTNSSTVTYNSSNNSVTNANTTASNNVLSMSNHLTQSSNTMSSATPSIATTQLNGQLLSNGNLSLQRNPHRLQELRQDNGLPSLQNSMNSLPNALLGHSTLPNGGLSIDPRYNATYGNPYLRNSNTSTLPGPNTANPAATPLPPPYNPALRNQSGANNSSNSNSLGIYGSSGGGGNLSSSILGISASASPNSNGSSSQQMLSPSGQFILPANGNLKKGALATHV